MNVFISCSGDRSKRMAVALEGWLPSVVQAAKPWISTAIEKGKRWSPTVAKKLEASNIGIFCVVPQNQGEPWLNFEAGAIAKTESSRVCAYLLDMKPADLDGPLTEFQATQATKDETLEMIRSINGALGKDAVSEEVLTRSFNAFWPELEEKLGNIAELSAEQPELVKPQRPDREMLEELLRLARQTARAEPSVKRRSHGDRVTRLRADLLRNWPQEQPPQIDEFEEVLHHILIREGGYGSELEIDPHMIQALREELGLEL